MSNVVIPATGSGDATPAVATDLVAAEHHQKVKVEWGANGTINSVDDTTGKRLPVVEPSAAAIKTNTDTLAGAISGGRMQTDLGASGGLATAAKQDTAQTALDAIAASASVLDDWDESDRAKVNPIVGQAGVAAGAGAVSATVQRTTLASDDPAVAVLGAVAGAAVITDANGTIQQYLRGLVKLFLTPGTIVLGAGSSAIGKLAVNAGVNIGDVNITDSATRDNGKIDIAGVDVNVPVANFPTTVDTNSGAKSASTIRVVLATDQPALTNKLLVTPDSVALPANQSVNVSQINGATPLMGAGNTGTGSPRVTIATDQLVLPVGGDVAAGSSDSGKPAKIGGVGHTANPTAVTDGQRVDAIFDKLGKQVVVGAIRDMKVVEKIQLSSSTSETTLAAAGGASVFKDMFGLIISNTSGTAAAVTIRHDTAGTIMCVIMVPAGEVRGFMLPVDSAVPQAAANKPWTAQSSASVAALELTVFTVKNL